MLFQVTIALFEFQSSFSVWYFGSILYLVLINGNICSSVVDDEEQDKKDAHTHGNISTLFTTIKLILCVHMVITHALFKYAVAL